MNPLRYILHPLQGGVAVGKYEIHYHLVPSPSRGGLGWGWVIALFSFPLVMAIRHDCFTS